MPCVVPSVLRVSRIAHSVPYGACVRRDNDVGPFTALVRSTMGWHHSDAAAKAAAIPPADSTTATANAAAPAVPTLATPLASTTLASRAATSI